MQNFFAYKNMRALFQKAQAAIPQLEGQIQAAEKLQPGLDAEAVKARALEAKDAKKKEELAEDNKQTIARLRGELPESRQKVLILEAELKKLEGLALADVRAKYLPLYSQAITEFVAAARVAAQLEQRVRSIKSEAETEINSVTLIPHIAVPGLRTILIEASGPQEYGPLARFIRDAKEEGLISE